MMSEKTEQALVRIETALARIEQATRRAASAATEQERRHDRLRAAVGETLRDLDLLISERQ